MGVVPASLDMQITKIAETSLASGEFEGDGLIITKDVNSLSILFDEAMFSIEDENDAAIDVWLATGEGRVLFILDAQTRRFTAVDANKNVSHTILNPKDHWDVNANSEYPRFLSLDNSCAFFFEHHCLLFDEKGVKKMHHTFPDDGSPMEIEQAGTCLHTRSDDVDGLDHYTTIDTELNTAVSNSLEALIRINDSSVQRIPMRMEVSTALKSMPARNRLQMVAAGEIFKIYCPKSLALGATESFKSLLKEIAETPFYWQNITRHGDYTLKRIDDDNFLYFAESATVRLFYWLSLDGELFLQRL